MVVTKREILVAIIIGAIILSIATLCFSVIQDKFFDSKTAFESALKIDNNKDLMDHALNTKVGNVLVTGIMSAVKPITFPEIKGEFIQIIKHKEVYTIHTSTSCNSKGQCTTTIYWSWDSVGEEVRSVSEVSFLGRNYNCNIFKFFPYDRLSLNKENTNTKYKISWDYIYESSSVRYYYKVVPKEFSTSLFATTKYGTLSVVYGSKISLYPYKNIKETIKTQDFLYTAVAIIYWVVILVIGGYCIYLYLAYDNDYLEKR